MRKNTLPLIAALLGTGFLVAAAAAATLGDLVIAEATSSASRALAGEQVAVSARVHNAGAVAVGPSRLKYYLSTDPGLDAADRYLNYDDVPALAASASNDETANVRVPAGTPDGLYYVLVVADFDGGVVELDETNNVFAIPITVGDAQPDLIVEAAALGASGAMAGEVVSASCAVANAGASAALVESRLKYYLSRDAALDAGDTYLNYDAVSPLAPGAASPETANLRVPAGTSDGRYFVLFVADANAQIAEADEANVVALPLAVGAQADLVLEGVSVAPEVRPGETLAVSATVVNAGVAAAPASRLVYSLSADATLDASDRQLSYDAVAELAPGAESAEEAALRVTTATPAGLYFVLFVIDADGAVIESDEENVVAVPVRVVADDPLADKPDLVLSGGSLEVSGDRVTATVTVENGGVLEAGASRLKYFHSTDAIFDPADRYLNYDAVDPLPVGAASLESASFTLGAGGFVLMVADATGEVPERYESNNVLALEVGSSSGAPEGPSDDPDAIAPDLLVSSLAVDSVEVSAGARASLRCTIENAGEHPAGESRVKYYLSRDARFDASDKYLGYDGVSALAPGAISEESVTPMIPATTHHGRWYLLAVADAASEVVETFESNNVAAVAIEVTVDDPTLDAPDLAAATPRLDRAVVEAGRKLDVTVAVGNLGTQPSGPSRVKLYLSRDALHDASDAFLAYRDLEALSVGAARELTADVRVPFASPDGPAFVLVIVDSERAIPERYESNNTIAIPVTIADEDAPPPPFPYACPSSVFTDASLLPRHTVASLNALHLGYANNKDMSALACIASHFDLLGLQEVEDPAGVIDLELAVEALTGEPWSSHVSEHGVGNENGIEYYAFLWRDAEVTMIAPRGFFDDPTDAIKREPYGADFRMGAFDFTYVIFHLQYGQTISTRRAEAAQLAAVYDYFQARNGSESDVLIGGDFNLAGSDPAFTLVGTDGITFITDPEQATSIGARGLANSFDNIFYTGDFTRELIGAGAHDYTMGNWGEVLETVTDHIPVWAAFDTGVDDD